MSLGSGWISILSQLVGWAYFACWSLSHYPQAILNYRRKKVDGLSMDFVTINCLGFACYSIYNANFLWNEHVREQYRMLHAGNNSSVMPNDVAVAFHAFTLSSFVLAQTWWYPRGKDQKVSTYGRVVFVVFFTLAILDVGLVIYGVEPTINFLYHLSYFKLYVSTAKYIPQAVMNWRRKSTVGFSIVGVLLDLSGGILSLFQAILVAHMDHDWSSAIGNPVKLGLSIQAIFFPSVYAVQHFVLYRGREPDQDDDSRDREGHAMEEIVQPLLAEEDT